jgi:hypothetical protein
MKIKDRLFVAADKACIIEVEVTGITPSHDGDTLALTTRLPKATANQAILEYYRNNLQDVIVNAKDVSQGSNIFSEQIVAVKFLNERRLIEIADLQYEIDKLKNRQIFFYP